MAGGWGYPVNGPMEIPQEPPFRYLAEDMPEVQDPRDFPMPEAPNVDTNRLRQINKALPPRPGGTVVMKGRMEEAAAEAFAMGQAFAITKSYNKAYANRAKAKDRAITRAMKHRPGQAVDSGRKQSNRNKSMEKYAGFQSAQAFGYHPYASMY
jgi:hypothetical protein